MRQKNWLTKISKVILRSLTVLLAVLVICLLLLTIPKVQTFVAHQATAFLSQKMGMELYIGKLHVDFDLNIVADDVRIYDQKNNNLISAKHLRSDFPKFKSRYLELNNVYVDSADVTFRTYEGEDEMNLKYFIKFFKRDKPKAKQKMLINFNNLILKNSRFQLRNDNKAGQDEEGVWNYSNMIISNINCKMHNMSILGDSLHLGIDQLNCEERSGFALTDYTGDIEIFRNGLYCNHTHFTTRNGSDVDVDFGMDFERFKSFRNLNDSVFFNSILRSSYLNTKDLTYFVKSFEGMNDMVKVEATVKGPLSDMKVRNVQLQLSKNTYFCGKVDMLGLPAIEETILDIEVDKMRVSMPDLLTFQLPKNKHIKLPKQLQSVEWASVQGSFLGLYDNFYADATLQSNIGDVTAHMMFNNHKKPLMYDGEAKLNQFDLGKILANNTLGKVTGTAALKGKGVKINEINTTFNAQIQNVEFNGVNISEIYANGILAEQAFNGSITCLDSNFDIEFNGDIDFNKELPLYNFETDIHHINLSNLKLYQVDSNVSISAKVKADVQGKTLDEMFGEVILDDIVYSQGGVDYPIKKTTLHVEQEADNKHILLNAGGLTVTAEGSFQYKNIVPAFQNQLHQYLPSLIPANAAEKPEDYVYQVASLNVDLQEEIPLLKLFVPNYILENKTKLNAYLDESKNELMIEASIDTLALKNQMLTDIHLTMESTEDSCLEAHGNIGGYQLKRNDTLNDVNNIDLEAKIKNNDISFLLNLQGNDNNQLENILLEGVVGFASAKNVAITLNNGSVVWDSQVFLLDTFNRVTITPENIHVDNFGMTSAPNKSLSIYSRVNERAEDVIMFDFNNIELGIANFILNRYNVSLEGNATGKGGIVNIKDKSHFAVGSDFYVDNFEFNNAPMGYVSARTVWVNEHKKLYIKTDIYADTISEDQKLTTIEGYFDPIKRYIDLGGSIKQFNIATLHPYLKSFCNRLEGEGTGTLSFKGPISDPKLVGEMVIENGVFGVDYLQTEYFIKKSKMSFVDTGFIFNNFMAQDAYGNPVVISGTISHQKLKNWGLDLWMKVFNAMAMNTTAKDNNLFYGKAFATGDVTMKGRAGRMIQINADVYTNPKTDITLMLDWSTTASESNFISFVSSDKLEANAVVPNKKSTTMGLNLKIRATPDAIVRVYLDPSIGGNIIGRGNGAVELNLDRNNDFTIYGTYTLTEGSFNLSYGDFLTRSFKLQSGSTLSWSGNPIGVMNVNAIQSTKVSINNLVSGAEEGKSYRPVSVNNILTMKGSLVKPDFTFSFELPDADEDIKSIVYNSIDTSDREEMVKQMISVLFVGMFEASNSSASGTINSGLGYSISELVSYQINRLVSSVSENLDVRVAYRNNEEFEESEYSVDLGGSFLNDRLIVHTSFGILDQAHISSEDRFLGDITLEYKLTKDGAWRLKAFNTTNQQNKLEYTSKYSQGIGVSFSKDFNTLKDLFKRRKKVAKEQDTSIVVPSESVE